MFPLYNVHGLVAWSEREIRLRDMMKNHFVSEMKQALYSTNPAWQMIQVETPTLIPTNFINANYTSEDVWRVGQESDNLTLRPETTPGTYLMAEHLLESHAVKPPLCVWQVGKSFRRESSDMSYGHMRLNEFYQLEFQCIYTADSKNDYHTSLIPYVQKMIAEITNSSCRDIISDRLPSYSESTIDIEAKTPLKWLELCSMSRRKDFTAKFNGKDMMVAEVAIGLDRCVHVFEKSEEKE